STTQEVRHGDSEHVAPSLNADDAIRRMRPMHFSHPVNNCSEQMRITFDNGSDVTKSDVRKREIGNGLNQSFYAACKNFVVSHFHWVLSPGARAPMPRPFAKNITMRSRGVEVVPPENSHVRFWHKADMPRPGLQCPLLGAKRTSMAAWLYVRF